MKFTHLLLALSFLSLCFISCEKINKEKESNKDHFDCIFTQVDENMDGLLDEEEVLLMNECNENAYENKKDIEKNLIGEWVLIGHANSWNVSPSLPCAYIIFEEDELTYKFEDSAIDTTLTAEWSIKKRISSSVWGDYYLNTNINLEIIKFSPTLMYSNLLPLDGDMYLYEKVK